MPGRPTSSRFTFARFWNPERYGNRVSWVGIAVRASFMLTATIVGVFVFELDGWSWWIYYMTGVVITLPRWEDRLRRRRR